MNIGKYIIKFKALDAVYGCWNWDSPFLDFATLIMFQIFLIVLLGGFL